MIIQKRNLASVVDCASQIRGKKYCAHDRVVYISMNGAVVITGQREGLEGGEVHCNATEYGGMVKYVYKWITFQRHSNRLLAGMSV